MSRSRPIAGLCADILEGAVPGEADLEALLRAGEEAPLVFAAAREARARQSGDAVFLYGFVYFSTYCRNECAFCFYRADNDESPRYRKTTEEVVEICRDLAASGVVLLDLTMGEDPAIHDEPGHAALLELVRAVSEGTGAPVMISPGVLPEASLFDLRAAGADWYALYQETHTAALYERLRVGQPFAARVEARSAARRAGLLVEDGLLTGIGDTAADRADSIVAMRESGWEQVRVMTFVPQAGTPLEDVRPGGDADELLTIAAMRLAMPDRFIPASLDVDGIAGLERRLQAGANVVTSIVPPTVGLAGVSQAELDIDEGHRTVQGVLPHLERLGLRPAGVDEYRERMARLAAFPGEVVRLLIVGGKLQGTEAAYLAAKAGWDTVLVDRRESPPAAGIAHAHVLADITADDAAARSLVTSCDAVLPACEDEPTLAWLAERVPAWDVPLLFDLEAYHVSASKLASRRLFEDLDVPRPRAWPACGFPVVVKPSTASGSEGVVVAHDEAGMDAARLALEQAGHEVVVEEYVAGPSLSLEVLAWGGRAVPLQVTGLEFDAAYDCRRVVAPVGETAGEPAAAGPGGACAWDAAVSAGVLTAFDAASVRVAEGLGLNGLMDVEVMVGGDGPVLLEIDARLPSQTPTAVYWSSGLNIVELLFRTVRDAAPPAVDRAPRRACVYQHVRASRGMLDVLGEHVMGGARPLKLVPGFFGAEEALTDYAPGRAEWAATLIVTGSDVHEARERAAGVVDELARHEHLRAAPQDDLQRADERGAR